ncbi:MAG: hypothetical protein HY278_02610 [candidate division NC10 bacterium]|nr:hypothetical protein [candidate division NC10 bacterium]
MAVAAAARVLLVPYGMTHGEDATLSHSTDEAAKQIAGVFPLVQGMVVKVDGDRVLVDLGARRGAYEGMELEVYREGEEVKHPISGQILGRRDVRRGVIRVVEVKEEFSEAVVVSLEKEAKLSWGDSVRVSSDHITVALPLIDPGDVRGVNVHSVTKDLAIALTKTGRFMLVEEPLIRASIGSERSSWVEHPPDPATMKILTEKLRAQALILGKISYAEKRVFLGLQVLSTRTGGTLGLASVELKGL